MGIMDKLFGKKEKARVSEKAESAESAIARLPNASDEERVEDQMGITGEPNVEKLKEEKEVEGLTEALKYKKDPSVREAAAKALCKVGDKQAVEPLIAALKDKEWVVRRYAAEALGVIGDTRAVEPLTAALDDLGGSEFGITPVRSAAAKALSKIEASQTATGALGKLLTRQWSNPSSSKEIKAKIETLTRNCESIFDSEVSKCLHALQELTQTKDPAVAEVLCYTALVASHYKVRNSAAHTLKTMANPEITQILCEALHYDRQVNPLVGSDWTLPTHALMTLEIIKDTSARSMIVDFLDDFRKTWSMKGDTAAIGMSDMFTLEPS